MKTIIFIVAGLLVGVAGGTFVGGTKEKTVILERMATEKATAEALEAQQHAEDTPPGDGSEHSEAGGATGGETGGGAEADPSSEAEGGPGAVAPEDAGHAPPAETTPADDGSTGHVGEPTPVGDPTVPAMDVGTPATSVVGQASGQPGAGDSVLGRGPERLAKIFGAMEPEEAAAVLQKLTDDEIRPILLNMSDRKVAAILENFVPERAASLSRTVLKDRSGND